MPEELPESVCITPADPLDLVVIHPVEQDGQACTFDSEAFTEFLRKELGHEG